VPEAARRIGGPPAYPALYFKLLHTFGFAQVRQTLNNLRRLPEAKCAARLRMLEEAIFTPSLSALAVRGLNDSNANVVPQVAANAELIFFISIVFCFDVHFLKFTTIFQ